MGDGCLVMGKEENVSGLKSEGEGQKNHWETGDDSGFWTGFVAFVAGRRTESERRREKEKDHQKSRETSPQKTLPGTGEKTRRETKTGHQPRLEEKTGPT